MKIGITGAGAVGCHYGSLLQQAGYNVCFLSRGVHLAAMWHVGLRHISGAQQTCLNVLADDNPSILQGCDVVILACKMTDLVMMLKSIAPYVGQQTLLLTLQNGVEAPDMAATAFPGHAIAAGTAFIGARIEKPGVVIHSAAGGIRLGLWQYGIGEEHFQPLIQACMQAGVPIREEADVRLMLWRKLLWNCGFNAITAITRRFAKEIAANTETLTIVREAMAETVALAQAKNIAIGEEDIQKHIQVTLAMGSVKTSMWQDIDRKKKSEVDYINGFIVQKAEMSGMNAPVNRMLTILMHAIEVVNPK